MVSFSTSGVSVVDTIKSATGTTSFGGGINEALGKVGDMLQSPAHTSAFKMKTAANSLFITDKVDPVALQAAFGQDGVQLWQALSEVQDLSDSFTTCGDFALNAAAAAATDYIKNSGIQQAGRELADLLGNYESEIDCVAGFATLFDGAGVIDDALGLGDLKQIQRRVNRIIIDSTNPQAISNMLASADVVQDLVADFNGMCQDMMGSLNSLIQKDLDAMQAALNKLAQWAAFAKLATGDPCALVNNHKMLKHIATPVMDDIVTLYQQVTGITASPTNPIIPLGDFLGKVTGGLPSLPKFKQQAGAGLQTFSTLSASIPTGTELVDAIYSSEEMEYVNGVGWTVPEGAQTDFTKEVLAGKTRFSGSKDNFINNAKDKAYEATAHKKNAVAKLHKVGWCTGGTDTSRNRDKAACESTKGDWNVKEMTDNEVKVAGSIEAAMGKIAVTLSDAFSSIVGDPPPGSPASQSVSGAPAVSTKVRDDLPDSTKAAGNPASPFSPAPAAAAKSSADPNTPTPFLPLNSASFVLPVEMPGRINYGLGASVASNFAAQVSNLGGDISEYHQSMEVVEKAMKTGDWSQVETCTCEPKAARASSKEVGSCDFTGLGFPEGYKLIEPSFYTPELLAKVDAAEKSGSEEYRMGDDGNIYQSAEVVVLAKWGATKVDPYLPGKAACIKYNGKWVVSQAADTGSSGGGSSFDVTNAKSKAVCENANGSWVCQQGTANSSKGNKAVESYGKFTNKKNVNTKSKLPTQDAFDTDKLPSLSFDKFRNV